MMHLDGEPAGRGWHHSEQESLYGPPQDPPPPPRPGSLRPHPFNLFLLPHLSALCHWLRPHVGSTCLHYLGLFVLYI